jgi:nitrate/nitrite transport system ATP-binding protein
MGSAFLSLNGVSKGFGPPGSRREVLRNIHLSIEKGEFVAIVGYSGAGKTTLISMIAGLVKPDAGEVTLDGREVTGPGPDRGVVFQNYSLLPWLSVYENVLLAVDQVFADWPKERKRAHVEKYIAMVNLAPARDKRPSQLSGGMRQRVAVARALAMDPDVLLLDEPLSALDALTRATLQDEVERIWERDQKTVVMITNDVDEGILLADRIVPLSAGPGATLGPEAEVGLPRPRDRKALNHHPRFKEIRRQVIEYLLDSGGRERRNGTRMMATEAASKPLEVGA